MLTEPLPGEEELLQRFSAAFNRVRAVGLVLVLIVCLMGCLFLGAGVLTHSLD